MFDLGKHDEFTRSICSDTTLAMIDGLPALLKNDPFETLQLEIADAHINHAHAIQSIESLMKLGHNMRSEEMTHTAFRFEYLARRTVEAYIAELEVREQEARKGVH